MFVIGRILKPHGVKGEVRVFPSTDDPSRYKNLREARIEFEDQRASLCCGIDHVKLAERFVYLKLKGIDSIGEAEQLRGGMITIGDEQALPLEQDEYYVRDLYDMPVFTENGERLGTIADVLETKANDVYVVRRENEGDILIPAVKQYIISIDINARIMTVRLAEGMR